MTDRLIRFIQNFFRPRLIPGLAGSFLFLSCAAVQAPSGGPVDEDPPQLVQSIPAPGTTQFRGGTTRLLFSEYLNEATLEKAIQVYPRPAKPVRIKYKGMAVLVVWPDSLALDQTYLLSIGRELQDEHRVPLAQTIQLPFSTGTELSDSRIAGTVFEEKGITAVNLWKLTDTEAPGAALFRTPDYVTKTADDGSFQFQYLSAGKYQICAVAPSAAGLALNPKRDKYGLWREALIDLAQNQRIQGINFLLWSEPPAFSLSSGNWLSPSWGKLTFTQPVDTTKTRLELNFYRDQTLILIKSSWYSDPLDAKSVIVQTDSMGTNPFQVQTKLKSKPNRALVDSSRITIRVPETPDTVRVAVLRPIKNSRLTSQLNNGPVLDIIFSKPVRLTKPLDSLVTLSRADSGNVPIKIRRISPVQLQLQPRNPWKPNATYTLSLAAEKIIGINRRSLAPAGSVIKLTTGPPQGYGGVKGIIKQPALETGIVVLNPVEKSAKKYFSTVNFISEYRFQNIPEGYYKMLIFEDRNRDGDYTYGKAAPYTPAEFFILNPDTIEIRANWDVEYQPGIFKEN